MSLTDSKVLHGPMTLACVDTTTLDVDTITWQSGTTVRYAFNGTPDLSYLVADGSYLKVTNATNATNNGTFLITNVNDGSDYVDVTNADRTDGTDDEATDSPATGEAHIHRAGVLKKEAVGTANLVTNEYSEELDDGSRRTGDQGRYLDVEVSHNELDTADLAGIEADAGFDEIHLEFDQADGGSGKTFKITDWDSILTDTTDMKTTLKIKSSVPIGGAWSDVFTIA